MRMRPKRPILRSLRRDVRRGEAVVFANGKRYVVVAQPIRRRLSPGLGITAGSRLEHIAPGTCDEYEGDGGHMWLCCKGHDGITIDCFRIVHGDPWHWARQTPLALRS